MANCAYVTYLGSDNYLIGILALRYQLKKYQCHYPLIVLITPNLSDETIKILDRNNISTILIDQIELSSTIISNNKKNGTDNWNRTFEKLKLFSLKGYEKIVYLDADMLVLDNLDNLFKKDNLSAVISGTKYPGNENWSQTLNSGLMVIVPKVGEDKRLYDLIGKGDMKDAGGDQGVIHVAYPDWPKNKKLHLGEEYNLLAPYESYYLAKGIVEYKSLKVIHYIGLRKPWVLTSIEKDKYILREIIKGLIINHSFKGLKNTIADFKYYYKLCRMLKNENKN